MQPWVKNIEDETVKNSTFRTVLFTGQHLQLTVMSLAAGEEIGVEIHPETDQFLRVEQGQGKVSFGSSKGQLGEEYEVADDWAMIVPAGTWHNIVNTGSGELKLYSIYAPPNHLAGTIHRTKAEATAAEATKHAINQ